MFMLLAASKNTSIFIQCIGVSALFSVRVRVYKKTPRIPVLTAFKHELFIMEKFLEGKSINSPEGAKVVIENSSAVLECGMQYSAQLQLIGSVEGIVLNFQGNSSEHHTVSNK